MWVRPFSQMSSALREAGVGEGGTGHRHLPQLPGLLLPALTLPSFPLSAFPLTGNPVKMIQVPCMEAPAEHLASGHPLHRDDY